MMNAPVVELLVQRIGYLVPGLSFVGTVQSVYARACNIASHGLLLTLVAPGISDGPTVLVLGGDRVADLRTCFRVRDRVVRRNGRLTSPGADVDLAHAASWHPDSEPVIADPAQVSANHRVAAATQPNIVALGQLLYSRYLFAFELAGLILLVAMIGAIVLTHRSRRDTRPQKVWKQIARRPGEAIELRDPGVGEGMKL